MDAEHVSRTARKDMRSSGLLNLETTGSVRFWIGVSVLDAHIVSRTAGGVQSRLTINGLTLSDNYLF